MHDNDRSGWHGLAVSTLFGAATLVATAAHAVPVSFSDDFGDGVLDPRLEDVAGAFTESGGTISKSSGARRYVRTVDSDFNATTSFTFEITLNVSGASGSDIAFVGFGPGTPDATLYDEPLGAFFRIHTSNLVGGRLDIATNTVAGGGWDSVTALGSPGDGTHRARIAFDGTNMLSFAYDQDFTGAFAPDFNTALALSSLPFDATNSRLFFGSTGVSLTSFDDLVVSVAGSTVSDPTALPEPGVAVLLATGLLGLARRRRTSA